MARVAEGVAELRRSDAQLSRRLSARGAPNDTDREAMRFIARAPEHDPATPGALAVHLGVSTAAVTGVIRRLEKGGFVLVEPNPADARSKVLRLSQREPHSLVDGLSSRVEAIATEFSPSELDAVARFLVQLAAEVEDSANMREDWNLTS